MHHRKPAHEWNLHLHQLWVTNPFSCYAWNTEVAQNLFTDLWLDGVPDSPMVGRASEAMWIFSTALCAVVGVMVAIGVAYQIHLDKISKKKKLEYQRSKRGKPLGTSHNWIQLSAQVKDIWTVFRFLTINCPSAFLFPTIKNMKETAFASSWAWTTLLTNLPRHNTSYRSAEDPKPEICF